MEEPERKVGLNTPKKENEYSVMIYAARLVNFMWNIETALVLYQSMQLRNFLGGLDPAKYRRKMETTASYKIKISATALTAPNYEVTLL